MKVATRGADHGAFIIDRLGTILAFDQAMESLTGWPACDVVGRNKEQCRALDAEGAPEKRLDMAPLYDGAIPMTPRSRTIPLTVRCRDGQIVEVEALAQRLEGPGERVLVTVLRVLARSPGTETREPAHALDALTGLLSAESFHEQLAAELESSRESARPLALILADVDRLRALNDRLGHERGDVVLKKLAGIFRVSVPEGARLSRLDGDDFAILLPGAGRGHARQLAASLRSTVERYRFFSSHECPATRLVTLSLGAASFPADADNANDLMDRARDALDEARAMGRNRVWCYLRRPRVPVEVPVFFDGTDPLLVGYTRDLSPSGIFVQTSVPIDIGMRCALAFPLPGRDSRVHVIGRVVRTVPPEFSADQDLRVPGMGVEFERFGGNTDRRAIESYLHEHEAETLRPETGPLSCG